LETDPARAPTPVWLGRESLVTRRHLRGHARGVNDKKQSATTVTCKIDGASGAMMQASDCSLN
jgi:hypothetical protein